MTITTLWKRLSMTDSVYTRYPPTLVFLCTIFTDVKPVRRLTGMQFVRTV